MIFSYKIAIKMGLDKIVNILYNRINMITKRIQRRNENIVRYRNKGMTFRALGKMFKLSHTQVMNIYNEYSKGERELVEAK